MRPRAHAATLAYYDQRAPELAARYESATVAGLHAELLSALAGRRALLELGAGSGREASFLLDRGFDVVATDASRPMLSAAVGAHPALAGRLAALVLPGPLPFPDATFDAVYAVAVLMHLDQDAIHDVLLEVRRVLSPGGRFLVSVPSARGDVSDDLDDKGRRFTSLPPPAWLALFARHGFAPTRQLEEPDGLGRPNVRWLTLTMERA